MPRKGFVFYGCFMLMSILCSSALAADVIPEPADQAATASDKARIDARPSAEEWVRGTLRYNGKTYDPVGVRYKGSVGGFLAPCTAQTLVGRSNGRKVGKCSMKISFDKYNKEGSFYGLKTINLHSMNRDESLMKDRLGYAMFREMGLAAPRAMHAKVLVNGQLEGLFVAVEQIDEVFTQSRWTEGGKGNLYKEVWPMYTDASIYRNALETNKGSSTNVNKMLGFERAIRTGPSALNPILSRDYMMRYLAVDRLIINDDGFLHWYCGAAMGNNRGSYGNHNYYWYEAQQSEKLWLIPWDLDSSFSENTTDFVHIQRQWFEPTSSCGCSLGAGFSSQRAAYCDPLTAIMATAKTEYDKMVTQFVAGPFSASRVTAKLDAWSSQIRTLVTEEAEMDNRLDPDSWRDGLADLRRIIADSRVHGGFWY
jgi:spore coat protein H